MSDDKIEDVEVEKEVFQFTWKGDLLIGAGCLFIVAAFFLASHGLAWMVATMTKKPFFIEGWWWRHPFNMAFMLVALFILLTFHAMSVMRMRQSMASQTDLDELQPPETTENTGVEKEA